MGLEVPGLLPTRRQALKGLGGLGAAVLWVAGCAARDPAGPAQTTAAAERRPVYPPGTLLWHVSAPAGIISLVAADGLLGAGIDDTSANVFGTYAMRDGTGRKAWTRYGDAAITPFAAGPGALFGAGPDGVMALSAASGRVLWTADYGGINLGGSSTWMLVADGTVCTTCQIGSSIQDVRTVVLGLDSGTGRRKWAADFPSIPTGLACAAGVVFAGSPAPPFNGHGEIAALDAATGNRRWTSADLQMSPGEMAATDGVVAVSTNLLSSSPGRDQTLALDSMTGRQLWHADGAAWPLMAGGGLVYGVTRTLWARDARTGRQVWERTIGRLPQPGVIAVTADTVLVTTGNKLTALSATAGNERWSRTLPMYPTVGTTADDVVYLAGESEPITIPGKTSLYAFQV